MSLFVRVNSNFYNHPKTLRLKAALGNDAYWLPPRIWAYAAEYHPDGDLSTFSSAEIASFAGYLGDASRMLEALLQAGFLDAEPLRIHDWGEYNSYHATYAARAKVAAAARWQKERTKEKEIEKRREETSNATSMLQACYKHAGGKEAGNAGNALQRSEVKELGLSFPQNLRTPQFHETWDKWVPFRKKIKACRDWVALFQGQLDWLASFPERTAIAILQQSIRNGWQGLFELRATQPNGKPKDLNPNNF